MTALRSPWLYGGWAAVVAVALLVARRVDPYLFGFATLILGGVSCAIGACGVGVIAFARAVPGRAKAAIALALATTAAALFWAARLLGGYSWA